MRRKVRKVWNITTTLMVTAAVILALLVVGVRFLGLQVFTVLSGSMEPAYPVGSLLYVKQVDAFDLNKGDVVTFLLDEDTVATHRIVDVVYDDEDSSVIRFRTKGDANEVEDAMPVHYKNVLGTPVLTIPYLGYMIHYVQKPPGMYVAISAGAILLLLVFAPDLLSDHKDKKEKLAN